MSREAWIVVGVIAGVIALATLYGAIRLARKLFVTKRMLGDLGTGGKVAFWGALVYTILPVDLLPDPIYLDDMGVLTAALLYLTHLLRKRRAAGVPVRLPGARGSGRSSAADAAPRRGRR
ncbi:uncharacterized membrane protein YkvA (DUF1232 family) [Hamadaea flava]|uniref:DUF1232 domain-containing protein n=1 Tax=Hamadaea flava TaxID=1742688 RepID=A0ABV8LQS3_9ACTN|nr:YkvA family protein [Hamadaea flava]MCP2327111.1 uncharacterized membrane protein YkvA (DUF1232 family) [Hamadaea flava]